MTIHKELSAIFTIGQYKNATTNHHHVDISNISAANKHYTA